MYIHGLDDYGDKYDTFKWDFDENTLKCIIFKDYVYKINDRKNEKVNNKIVEKLHNIRKKIGIVAQKMDKFKNTKEYNDLDQDLKNSIDVFIDLHGPNNKYLLSEIPLNVKQATMFYGINKPRKRKYTNNVPANIDGKLRASYRDIFINPELSKKSFEDTLIHELTHSFNDCTWKKENHGLIFDRNEKFLKKFWN